MEAKIVSCVCHGPEKGSKYNAVQTTFSEINNYNREIFVKINITDNLCTKTKILHVLSLKSAVYTQERLLIKSRL